MIEDAYWLKNASGGGTVDLINPREQELLQEALATSDDAKREAIYHDIALEMIEDRIIVPVVSPNLALAYRSNVEGVRYSACCNLPLAEISLK